MERTYKELAAEHPDLCAAKHWTEDNNFLARIGITVPGKDQFPSGFVKLYPQDFIVEEVAEDGTQYTIEKTDVAADTQSDGETIYATLVKYNLTTFEAERLLAEQLGCDQDRIQHAGIKDQRAVTAQRISIRKVPLAVVEAVTHPQFFLKDIVVGKGVLKPGMLTGNRFTIVIRTEPALLEPETSARLVEAFTAVTERGFYNFYYLQRFAAPRYNSPRWGRSLLLGAYEEALHGMMTDVSETEPDFFTAVRQGLGALWGDWSAMLAYIDEHVPSDQFAYEKTFLSYLEQHPEDFLGALRLEINHVRLCMYGFGALLHNEQLSHLIGTNRSVPETLPVIVSYKREDTNVYRHLLQQLDAWPPKFPGLKDFPEINRHPTRIKTTSAVTMHSIAVAEGSITLQFTLAKGEYATTFLSHLFNLLGGTLSKHELAIETQDIATLPAATTAYFAAAIAETKPE